MGRIHHVIATTRKFFLVVGTVQRPVGEQVDERNAGGVARLFPESHQTQNDNQKPICGQKLSEGAFEGASEGRI